MVYCGGVWKLFEGNDVPKNLMSSYVKRVALPPGTPAHWGEHTAKDVMMSLVI